MYQGSLPATSNREDFEAIFQLVDEDTGDLIDLTSASIEFDISASSDHQAPKRNSLAASSCVIARYCQRPATLRRITGAPRFDSVPSIN